MPSAGCTTELPGVSSTPTRARGRRGLRAARRSAEPRGAGRGRAPAGNAPRSPRAAEGTRGGDVVGGRGEARCGAAECLPEQETSPWGGGGRLCRQQAVRDWQVCGVCA